MDLLVLGGGAWKLAFALVAVFSAVLVSSWLDRRGGITLSEVLAEIRDGNIAPAVPGSSHDARLSLYTDPVWLTPTGLFRFTDKRVRGSRTGRGRSGQ